MLCVLPVEGMQTCTMPEHRLQLRFSPPFCTRSARNDCKKKERRKADGKLAPAKIFSSVEAHREDTAAIWISFIKISSALKLKIWIFCAFRCCFEQTNVLIKARLKGVRRVRAGKTLTRHRALKRIVDVSLRCWDSHSKRTKFEAASSNFNSDLWAQAWCVMQFTW